MVVPVKVRAPRASALLFAQQTAKGAPVSDFTLAASLPLYAEETEFQVTDRVEMPDTMDSAAGPAAAAGYAVPETPESDSLPIIATKEALTALLTSNYGTPAAGVFALETAVADARWFTLAGVENVSDNTQRLIRTADVWIHKLELDADYRRGKVLARAHWKGGAEDFVAQSGYTLPAAPMTPANKRVFPSRLVSVVRDPAGLNVPLRVSRAVLTFDQNLGTFWAQDLAQQLVFKKGKLRATLELWSEWSEETWAIVDDNAARTRRRYRVTMTGEDGAVFQTDLYNVLMMTDPAGRQALQGRPFHAVGQAASDGANFVTLTLN